MLSIFDLAIFPKLLNSGVCAFLWPEYEHWVSLCVFFFFFQAVAIFLKMKAFFFKVSVTIIFNKTPNKL